MTTALQIYCIGRTHSADPDEVISTVGVVNSEGKKWIMPAFEVIYSIDNNEREFYMIYQGNYKRIRIAVSEYGHKYLSPVGDNPRFNSLLTLPEC